MKEISGSNNECRMWKATKSFCFCLKLCLWCPSFHSLMNIIPYSRTHKNGHNSIIIWSTSSLKHKFLEIMQHLKFSEYKFGNWTIFHMPCCCKQDLEPNNANNREYNPFRWGNKYNSYQTFSIIKSLTLLILISWI